MIATIKLNTDSYDSDSDIIIVEDDQHRSNNNESPINENMAEKFEGNTIRKSTLRLKSQLK